MKGRSCFDGYCPLPICPSNMNRLELVLRVAEMLGKVSHLIDVSFLAWTELSEHVPLEYAFETLLIHLANAFLALDCCYCGSC